MSPAERVEARRMRWVSGMTHAAIAQTLGVTPTVVAYHCRDLPRRIERHAIKHRLYGDMRALRAQGLTIAAIGVATGRSTATVSLALRGMPRKCQPPHPTALGAPRPGRWA